MASLTSCIKKAGGFLSAADKKALLAIAKELREGGLSNLEAGRKAVARHLETVKIGLEEQTRKLAEAKPQAENREFAKEGLGSIRLEDGKKIISLFEKADASTLFHESSHAWLEELIADATRTDAPQQLKDDLALVRQYLGNDGGALTVEQHERFARTGEAYLMEGKAPSRGLARIFSRFKQWLTKIYGAVEKLDVPINNEIRGVFDRLLATDAEIAEARKSAGLEPNFKDREEAGMTQAEWGAYLRAIDKANQEAESTLLDKMMARVRRQRTAEFRRERAEVAKQVTTEIDAQPDMQALNLLRATKAADGSEQKVRLSLDAVRELYGEEMANELPHGVLAKDGLPPDVVAGLLKLDSADALMSMLRGLEREQRDLRTTEGEKRTIRQYRIDTETDRRMGDRRTELEDEASIRDEAMAAVHSEARAELLATELRYLRRLGARDLENRGEARKPMQEKLAALEQEYGDLKVAERWNAAEADLMAKLEKAKAVAEVEKKASAAAEKAEATIADLKQQIADLKMTDRWKDAEADLLARLEKAKAVAEAERKASKAAEKAQSTIADLEQKIADLKMAKRWNEAEQRSLRDAVTITKPMLDAMRAQVDTILSGKTLGEIGRYEMYLRNERKAALEVQRAILKKDWAAAAAAKQRQILSNILFTRARQAATEIDRGVNHLQRLQDNKSLSIDPEYRAQIYAMLERFDLRKSTSEKEIARRESLKAFLDQMEKDGVVPNVPEYLIDEANRTHYKRLSLTDFRDLVDAVKAIEHLGRLKNRLLTSKAKRDFEAARGEMVATIKANAGDRKANVRDPATDAERAAAFARRFGAAHVKVATLARILDGGKDGGPVWEYLVRTANERGDMETTMRAEATEKLTAILKPISKGLSKKRFYDSIGRAMTREQVIGMALNMGNEGNKQRLLGGEGWTMAQVQPVLDTLTSAEWKAVQAIWDHFESYRPLIGAKEMRVYGAEPKWVEPVPLNVRSADGQDLNLRGGYYPITYDPMASVRAEQHADAELAKRQMQNAYTSSTTRRSFTKERVGEVEDRPLIYTLKGLYSGVNDVIHDLAWHEWLIDANKIVRDGKFDHAVRSTYGPEVIRQFKSWINDIAEGDKGLQAELDSAIGKLRHGVSVAGLGFNVVSALMQPLGLTQSISRIGLRWVGKGLARYVAHPFDATKQVNADSAFMANRARTRFRELNELRNRIEGESTVKEVIGTYGYWLMARMQQAVDVPTWLGAFEKATAEGHTKDRAVALADQAVIDSQGGGQTKDLSAIERGGPAQKLFTVFYSFMNTAMNLGIEKTMSANTPTKKAKLAVDYLILYGIPAVFGAMLKDAITPGDSGNWDEDDKIVKSLAKAQIEYLFGLVVLGREFAGAARAVAGLDDHVIDYKGPAGLRVISDVAELGKQLGQVWKGGEFDDAFRKALINSLGSAFGLPSAQMNRSITGVEALQEGKTDNPAAVLFGYQEQR